LPISPGISIAAIIVFAPISQWAPALWMAVLVTVKIYSNVRLWRLTQQRAQTIASRLAPSQE
jgi:hypothetical protein